MVMLPGEEMTLVGINILILCGLIYLFQGLAIASFFFRQKRVPAMIRWLFYSLLLIQQYMLIFVIACGLLHVGRFPETDRGHQGRPRLNQSGWRLCRHPLWRKNMKVILKQNVDSLGKAGDLVKVADGYARNFLIPKGLAAEASSRNLKTFEHEKQRIMQQAEKIQKLAEEMAAKLSAVTCTIARRVGEQEKLFGSVGAKDIEEALIAQGIEIEKKSVLLEEPIKSLGEYQVKIRISAGMTGEIKVVVAAES